MDYYKNYFVKSTTKRLLSFLVIFNLLIIGCAPTPTFIKPDFNQKHVKVIAIMPVVDKRNFPGDSVNTSKIILKLEELLSNKIAEKNYDVISVNTVKNIIKAKEIKNLSPQVLGKTFNADGILFTELYEFADEFYTDHSLKIHISIYDSHGDSLWVNELDNSDKPFLSALGASLGWAIGVAVDNKISSKNKLPIILGGIAAAQLVYTFVDAVSDETSQSIDDVLRSLPQATGFVK